MVSTHWHIQQRAEFPEKVKDFCGRLSGWTLEMVFIQAI